MLVPCSGCRRHVRADEAACPFCGGDVPREVRTRPAPTARLSRGALIAFTVSALGCGSTETASAPDDAGVDTRVQDARPEVPSAVYGAPPDTSGGAIYGGPPMTTGNTCVDDAECDPTESGSSFCSTTGFTSGSLFPTPVCFSADCDPGDGSKIVTCDGDKGVCLSTGSGGICLPVCEFDDSTAAPKGCAGKNKCTVYGWGTDSSTTKTIGVGYCFGGCKADADCPTGNKCQVEDGLCVKAPVVYVKTPGTACTDADATAPAKCNCLYSTAEKAGYCARACYFGETDCGTGFTCDVGLPKTKVSDGDTIFSFAPAGIAGYCLKNCDTDADCAGLNAYCNETAGTGRKTCQVGKRPCSRNDQCPAGQTCMGATATTVGRCG